MILSKVIFEFSNNLYPKLVLVSPRWAAQSIYENGNPSPGQSCIVFKLLCNCYQPKAVVVCVLLLQLLERFVTENISYSQTFNETVQCVFFQPANFQPNVPYHITLSAACERVSVY